MLLSPVSAHEDALSPAMLMIEEFSHRALNDYTGAIGMLHLAATNLGDPAARAALKDAAKSLHDRAQTFRVLRAPSEEGPLNLADYLQTVCKTLSSAYLTGAGIRLTLVRETIKLPADQCWRIGLALSELIMNAARHGLQWEKGEIRVEMSVGDIEVCCAVTDNGCPPAFPGLGRGTRIISALLAGMGGRADWAFGPDGACATVQIPRPARPALDFATVSQN
jgi:two-component sensor histidine kinase